MAGCWTQRSSPTAAARLCCVERRDRGGCGTSWLTLKPAALSTPQLEGFNPPSAHAGCGGTAWACTSSRASRCRAAARSTQVSCSARGFVCDRFGEGSACAGLAAVGRLKGYSICSTASAGAVAALAGRMHCVGSRVLHAERCLELLYVSGSNPLLQRATTSASRWVLAVHCMCRPLCLARLVLCTACSKTCLVNKHLVIKARRPSCPDHRRTL